MASDRATLYDATRAALAQVIGTDGSVSTLNEAETRTHVIDPVLGALGYQTLDQIRREYRLEASGQFVDYLLRAGEQRIVVEAKSLGTDLSPKDASQLVGYCATEGIRWALLTNGFRWQVFDIEVTGNWDAKRVAEIDLLAAYRNETLADALEPVAHFERETLVLDDSHLRAWAHEERARTHLDQLVSDPSSPVIETVVAEMAKVGIDAEPEDIVALLRRGTSAPAEAEAPARAETVSRPTPGSDGTKSYYIFPAAGSGGFTAQQYLEAWLRMGMWGVGKSTAHRTRLKAGDECCFYAGKIGVVAHARISGPAIDAVTTDEWPGPDTFSEDVYKVPLSDVQWLATPRSIDADLRSQLDEFKGRGLSRRLWGWFVQSTGRLTEHDLRLLTGSQPASRTSA